MKKAKGKRSGTTKEYVTELYGYENDEKNIEVALKALDTNISEIQFLNLFRLLKFYKDRKKRLEERGYKLVGGNWEKEIIGKGDSLDFYYNTITVNESTEIEEWVKRKSFDEIKQLLIKTGMIFGVNPYEKYIVLGDDMETEHIFYRKK